MEEEDTVPWCGYLDYDGCYYIDLCPAGVQHLARAL